MFIYVLVCMCVHAGLGERGKRVAPPLGDPFLPHSSPPPPLTVCLPPGQVKTLASRPPLNPKPCPPPFSPSSCQHPGQQVSPKPYPPPPPQLLSTPWPAGAFPCSCASMPPTASPAWHVASHMASPRHHGHSMGPAAARHTRCCRGRSMPPPATTGHLNTPPATRMRHTLHVMSLRV